MSEEGKEPTKSTRPQRHVLTALFSALVGCGCGLILFTLLAAGSFSAVAALDPMIMTIQPFMVGLSVALLVGTILLNLRLEKCCNLAGLKARRKLVLTDVAIYVVVLILFLLVIEPYLMAAVYRFMPM